MKYMSSKTPLFLIEFLASILIFSVCAVVCVRIYEKSELLLRSNTLLPHSITAVSNAAECYKASGGAIVRAAEYLRIIGYEPVVESGRITVPEEGFNVIVRELDYGVASVEAYSDVKIYALTVKVLRP